MTSLGLVFDQTGFHGTIDLILCAALFKHYSPNCSQLLLGRRGLFVILLVRLLGIFLGITLLVFGRLRIALLGILLVRLLGLLSILILLLGFYNQGGNLQSEGGTSTKT